MTAEVPRSREGLTLPGRFHGQNALVTGVSDQASIGAAIMRRFAREDAAGIRGISRPESAQIAQAFMAELSQYPTETDWVGADLSKPSEITRVVSETRDRFGKIDILVVNHGISRPEAFRSMTWEKMHDTIETNLESPMFLISRAVSEGLIEEGGRIVINGSFLGVYGSGGHEAYSAAKAGLIGYIAAAAQPLAEFGIIINGVFPGDINTRMSAQIPRHFQEATTDATPVRRRGTPEDVAFHVLNFADPEASFATGQILIVDGGLGGGAGGARRLVDRGYVKVDPEERRLVMTHRRQKQQGANQESQG